MSELTIEVEGVKFDVEFDYQPEEAQVRYYSDGSGYPGCAEEVSIYSIKHKGEDISDLFDSFERFESAVLDSIHGSPY